MSNNLINWWNRGKLQTHPGEWQKTSSIGDLLIKQYEPYNKQKGPNSIDASQVILILCMSFFSWNESLIL